jgi:hypothetical protein
LFLKARALAAAQHGRVVLGRALRVWRRARAMQRRLSGMEAVADARRAETLQRLALGCWLEKQVAHRRLSTLRDTAQIWAERALLQQTWRAWRERLWAVRLVRANAAMADDADRTRTLRASLRAWRQALAARRSSRVAEERLARTFARGRLARAFRFWRARALLVSRARRHEAQAETFAYVHLVGQAWSRWRQRLAEMRARQSLADRMVLQRQRGLLRRCFEHWLLGRLARVHQRRLLARAVAHHRRATARAVLRAWHLRSSIHAMALARAQVSR